MKRHNFSAWAPRTVITSTTARRVNWRLRHTRSRVQGTKMAGRMGGGQVTTTNLEVISVDVERHLVLVKGAVPGRAAAPWCCARR